MESGCKVNRKPSPAENINCLSFATFWYAIETFIRYLKLETTESNLPQAHSKMKSEFLTALVETAWKNEIQRAGEMKTKPSLERVLLKVFGLEYFCISVLVLFGEISKIIQALAIGQLLKYSTPGQTEISKFESYFCIAVIPLCNFLYTFFVHVPFAMASNVGLKLRAACSCLIYKKCLKLDTKVLAQTTTGHVINLLSNDVGKFEQACLGGVDIFLGPLVTIFCIYLICTGIGPSAAVGIGMLLILNVVQTALSITISGYYSKSARRTDERVRLMNEIITAVQVIKMYAWEKPFSRLVDLARRQEIDKIKVSTKLKTFSYAYIIFVIRLSLFTSFLTYVLFGNEITTEKTFLLISLFNILRSPMTIFFPRFVPIIFEARISVKRIRDFLLLREKEERTDSFDQMKINFGILLTNGCAQWNKNQMTLKEVNVEVNSGEILAIIGPVGSGKSTLLQVILKELPLTSGKLAINGRVSYSSQQPWLFNGSVQQNIIFGEPMKKDRYEEVVSVCSLLRDFDQFPNGDQSIVGDRGISLSGGQKARISLARAVYKEADIYLLDDPLSAVDTEVGRNLFENCILGYLKKKVVVLVTHQLHHLGDVDKIICLNDGEVKSSGRLHDLQVSGLDMKFIASKEHKETEKKVFQEKMKHKSEVRRNIEEITEKSVITTLFFGYFKAATNYYVLSLLCLIFLLTQFFGSSVDYFMSFWVDLEESNYKTGPFSRDSSLIIYCTLIATLIGLSILLPVIFSLICMKASIKLHDDLYSSIIKATMKFFNVNSAGRILNRFSQDMGVIDGVLPAYLLDTIIMNLNVLAIIILIAILNTWLLVPVIVMATCAYCLRKVYVKVGRNIKNLQARTLSPIFAHTNATLQDLTTIRALGAENILQKEFESHQDLHTAAFFDFISTARFFGLYLDCLCALMVAAVVFIFFFTEGNSSSHFGLAITQATMLTGIFQWSIKVTCEVENQSVSVDRVLEYQNIEHEQRRVSQSKVPKLWPENGKIIFKSVSLHYYPEDPPTLKDLSFTILPKEKVGIVGRTGAGKSSIINAIFQLTETEGTLIIDEIDVKSVNLQDLRSRISIIPQEPFLFSGTIRRNLDPFSQYPDTVLWRVLADVELKNVVSDLSSGLEAEVSEGGSNFSVGQRQLVCLARAILRNNKILILDEATANIDPQTDALIQNTIRKKFIDCTVLTVAHRLDTVMDSDKILVLDDGTVSQFGHPHDLLQDQNGPFHRLVQETGKATAERLIAIAELNFYKMRQ